MACSEKPLDFCAHLKSIAKGRKVAPLSILRKIIEDNALFDAMPDRAKRIMQHQPVAASTLIALPRNGDGFGGSLTMVEKPYMITLIVGREFREMQGHAFVIDLAQGNFEATFRPGNENKVTIEIGKWESEWVLPVEKINGNGNWDYAIGGEGGFAAKLMGIGDVITFACAGKTVLKELRALSIFDQGSSQAFSLFER